MRLCGLLAVIVRVGFEIWSLRPTVSQRHRRSRPRARHWCSSSSSAAVDALPQEMPAGHGRASWKYCPKVGPLAIRTGHERFSPRRRAEIETSCSELCSGSEHSRRSRWPVALRAASTRGRYGSRDDAVTGTRSSQVGVGVPLRNDWIAGRPPAFGSNPIGQENNLYLDDNLTEK